MLLKPTVFELEDTMLRVKKTSGVQHQLGNSDSPMRVPSQSTPINEQVNNTTNESLLDLSANINTGRAATSISVVKNSEPMIPLIPAKVDKKSAPRPSLSQKLSSPAKVRVVEVCEDEDGGLRLLWQEHVEAKPPVQFERLESTDEIWSMFDDSDSD